MVQNKNILTETETVVHLVREAEDLSFGLNHLDSTQVKASGAARLINALAVELNNPKFRGK